MGTYQDAPYFLDAYGIAVKRGYDGDVDEWLESLKGERVEIRFEDNMWSWRYASDGADAWQDVVSFAALHDELLSAAANAEAYAKEAAEYATQAYELAGGDVVTSSQLQAETQARLQGDTALGEALTEESQLRANALAKKADLVAGKIPKSQIPDLDYISAEDLSTHATADNPHPGSEPLREIITKAEAEEGILEHVRAWTSLGVRQAAAKAIELLAEPLRNIATQAQAESGTSSTVRSWTPLLIRQAAAKAIELLAEPLRDLATQSQAEAGTSVNVRAWSPQRVRENVLAARWTMTRISMPFASGWTGASSWYMRTPFNMVYVHIVTATTPSSWTDATVVATLPSGYRPPNGVSGWASSNHTTGTPHRCEIDTSGRITIVINGSQSANFVQCGICFPAA